MVQQLVSKNLISGLIRHNSLSRLLFFFVERMSFLFEGIQQELVSVKACGYISEVISKQYSDSVNALMNNWLAFFATLDGLCLAKWKQILF